MNTFELKNGILEKILFIDDNVFLEALTTIIDTKIAGECYKLTDYQKKRISAARAEYQRGETIAHAEIVEEVEKRLDTK